MSVKKKIKPGRIEPSADGHSIVVHFTTEIAHLDEDGNPVDMEKTSDKREVNVARHLRSLREQDIPTFAQEIVEKCRYIPATKTRRVEEVLTKLLSATTTSEGWLHSPRRASSGSRGCHGATSRGSFQVCDDMRATRSSFSSPVLETVHLSDVLPKAHISHVDDYAEELYEERMEAKILGARQLLSLCTEARQLEKVSEHSMLLGVLSRELRENSKRSHELTVAITGIFSCLANFSQFHSVLVQHQCSDITMRVVEYECRRRAVLTKELDLKRGRLVALGSQASCEESNTLRKEEDHCKITLDRQDRLLQLCLLVLRNLAEDVLVEKSLVARHVCKYLIRMLDRSNEDLLLITLSFLHKLVTFEENKDLLVQQPESVVRLAELTSHSCAGVALLSMRVCYNISFDRRARHTLVGQTKLLNTLVVAAKLKTVRKMALKLLYQLTMDASARGAAADRCPDCISLAVQLVANSPENRMDKDAVAIFVNLAAHEGCAKLIVEHEQFPKVAARGVQLADVNLLKVLRHVSSHSTMRSRLLEVLAADGHGGSTWLHEMIVFCTSHTATPDHLVECIGILANLECQTPEVAWPELIEAGLLELLERLLDAGLSDDDVLLECIQLTSVLALDPEAAPLLAASKVPTALPRLLTDKQEDCEIIVQLLFTLRCLLLQEDTCEVLLQETDVPDRILDLLHEFADVSRDSPGWQVIHSSAEETLQLITAADSQNGRQSHWAERIKAFRFQLHNDEWCQRLQNGERNQDAKSSTHMSGANTTQMSGASRSWMRWTDASGIADRCWGSLADDADDLS